jgi:rubrerythrin
MLDIWHKETIESILKKAVSKENDSYLFYKNAANNAKDAHVKNALNRLAEKEREHIQAIEALDLKRLKRRKMEEINETSQQWIAEYLIISTEEGLSKDSDFKDVFIYAAKREKKAFEFYHGMSKLVEDPELKKLFVWLAEEESKHEAELFYDLIYR